MVHYWPNIGVLLYTLLADQGCIRILLADQGCIYYWQIRGVYIHRNISSYFSGELESNIEKSTTSGANYLLSLDPDINKRGKVSS